ncbi:hypothetical protein K1T71_009461 [Dendrolimus kikuchii]|uniref:Uncharacterized protein n=1 Tax=Dendrolimus kikuchii TaxID=765133 RepID=A0ACC1CUM0_9NEOP|nr:hypothetical protein K1T71_009461 [Dendrolimus kikuchii]
MTSHTAKLQPVPSITTMSCSVVNYKIVSNMFWTAVLVAVICYVLRRLFFEAETHPLDHLPGPPRLPIIGTTLKFVNASPDDLFKGLREYAQTYKDRYLIKIFKRRILHLTNAKDIEIILSHSKNIMKNRPYRFMESWLGTGLLLSTGAKWHARRKILTPTFHFNILKNFVLVMEEKSRRMVETLKETDGQEVNLIPIVSDYTLHTICETAMGTQLDSNKTTAKVEYKRAILEIGHLLFTRLTKVWLHNEYIFKKFPLGKQYAACLHKVHSFADSVINERKIERDRAQKFPEISSEDKEIGTKKRMAMLDLLLDAEDKGAITLEGIREEVNTFMFEGHDTTAMAITFSLMLLADHQEVQDRIYEEMQQIFGDTDRSPSMADLTEMKYLEAVIKETLRLYPSVPFISRQITEDVVLDDLLVPKGAEVAVHIYDLHRREELFPEPEVFRPERFFSNEIRHPYAFVPFSAGPRNCIGQKFAMLEMKCLLSEIIRNFTLKPRNKGARPTFLADMLLRPAEPIYIHFIKR